MFHALKDLFDRFLPPQQRRLEDAAQALQLASAVLLVEVMRADAVSSPGERTAVGAALQRLFGLDAAAAAALIARAEDTARHASDTFGFTSQINDALDMEHKIALVEALWSVAYAEGGLGAEENHLLRKVVNLLHVPQGAAMNAKMRARAAAGPCAGPAPA
ncbi:MAG: TerB family tellurite resistance protein [Burkholderiales bacterium]|nr:TerB family tellurite resistance protein [Burkholderiales bacterium]MDE2452437.1 TerB family tellurite resistance protein [Burkholderiales bacterium]